MQSPSINTDEPPLLFGQREAPPLPSWTAEEKSLWLDLLETFTPALLPADDAGIHLSADPSQREARGLEAVQLAARMADQAVREFQYRMFAQSAEIEEPKYDEQFFADFTQWLRRRGRRAATTTARTRRRASR
jgi:hypothetical protein